MLFGPSLHFALLSGRWVFLKKKFELGKQIACRTGRANPNYSKVQSEHESLSLQTAAMRTSSCGSATETLASFIIHRKKKKITSYEINRGYLGKNILKIKIITYTRHYFKKLYQWYCTYSNR